MNFNERDRQTDRQADRMKERWFSPFHSPMLFTTKNKRSDHYVRGVCHL